MLEIDVSAGARVRRLVAACMVLVNGAAFPARAADDSHLRIETTAALENFYFESVILSLSILFKGAGEEEKGLCVSQLYFGSPLGQWAVLHGFWQDRDKVPELLGLYLFDVLCRNEKIDPPSPQQWEKAAGSHRATLSWAKETDLSLYLFAGMRTMFTFAAVRLKDQSLAKCIVEKYDDAFEAKVLAGAGAKPVLWSLYDEMRGVCPLFPNGPESKDMVWFKLPDFDGAARERLLAVAEFKACDGQSGSSQTECRGNAFNARIKALE